MDVYLILLAIIVIVVVTTVFTLIRQSYIIGVIFAGMCFGYFGVFQPDEIKFFSDVGILLLLFLIGAEFDIKKIGNSALSIVVIALLKFFFIFMMCYQVFLFLFSPEVALVLAAAFAFSSTAIVAKIAKEKNILKEKETQIMIGVLVIEDVIVVILLALMSGTGDIKFSVVKIFLLILLSYFVFLKIINKIFNFFVAHKVEENILLFTIIFCIAMASLTNFLGFSGMIGAFIAGNLVGSTKHNEAIKKIFEPFSMVFIMLFFFSVGMMINIEKAANAFVIIVLFVVLNIFLKFYVVSSLYHILEYNKEQAIRSGIMMLSLSEFSLVLLLDAVNKSLITTEILSAFGIAFIISAFLSSVALNPKIFGKADILLIKQSFFDEFASKVHKTKTGIEEAIIKKIYAEGGSLWKDAIAVLTIFAVSYVLCELGYLKEGMIFLVLSLPYTIHSIIKIARIIKEIMYILHSFLVISKVTERRIIGNIAVIIILSFILSTNFFILSFLHIEFMHQISSIFFGVILLFFIYDTISMIAAEKANLKDTKEYIENMFKIKKI